MPIESSLLHQRPRPAPRLPPPGRPQPLPETPMPAPPPGTRDRPASCRPAAAFQGATDRGRTCSRSRLFSFRSCLRADDHDRKRHRRPFRCSCTRRTTPQGVPMTSTSPTTGFPARSQGSAAGSAPIRARQQRSREYRRQAGSCTSPVPFRRSSMTLYSPRSSPPRRRLADILCRPRPGP